MNKIHAGDCLDIMRQIPDNSIDLVVTSPPYNKGFWSKNRNPNNGFKTKSRRIDYGIYDDKMEPTKYAEWQSNVLKECCRIIKPSGSIFYNHTDILNEHQTQHPIWVHSFPIKQIIVWDRKNTPRLDKSYFFPITEWIFWIKKTKDSRVFFDRHKSDFNSSVWRISPDSKNKHSAPFPISIPLNCIKSCCPNGGVVFDPFMGSGTTAVASKILGVNYLGAELNPEYVEIANRRIAAVNKIEEEIW